MTTTTTMTTGKRTCRSLKKNRHRSEKMLSVTLSLMKITTAAARFRWMRATNRLRLTIPRRCRIRLDLGHLPPIWDRWRHRLRARPRCWFRLVACIAVSAVLSIPIEPCTFFTKGSTPRSILGSVICAERFAVTSTISTFTC